MTISLNAAQPQKILNDKDTRPRSFSFPGFGSAWFKYLILCGAFLLLFFAQAAHAACTSPAGAESATRYDFTAHKLSYCNGTNWVEISGAAGGASHGGFHICSNTDGSSEGCAAGTVIPITCSGVTGSIPPANSLVRSGDAMWWSGSRWQFAYVDSYSGTTWYNCTGDVLVYKP